MDATTKRLSTIRRGRKKRKNQFKVRNFMGKGDDDGGNHGAINKEEDDKETYQTLQSYCQECNSTAKDVQYRPLVNENGSYLCNTCYKVQFPATAMYDSTLNDKFIVRKYQEFDIRKTQRILASNEEELDDVDPATHTTSTATSTFGKVLGGNIPKKNKKEKDEDFFPEEEECRSCLDKGVFRKCCKNYYCNTCYYHNGTKTCPGCGSSIHRSGVSLPKSKPTKLAVLASWGITLSIVLLLMGITYICIMHNLYRPETVWQNTCHGWFPSCDKPVCIDADKNATFMPAENQFCSIDKTVNKVIGMRCIIDPQLYQGSNGASGFDICLQDSRRASHYKESFPSASTSITKKEFQSGIYVFEDNFDYWKNKTNFTSESIVMKSARWSYMINARVSDMCGINDIVQQHEVDRPPSEEVLKFKTPSALVFSGVKKRYAETIPLDVRYGGMVEFHIKFAPLVENELVVECKSAYAGDVTLSYSLDDGLSWHIIRTYQVWKYRTVNFTFINETIPFDAQSEHTQFKWEQPVFDPLRDFWALDDVRIFHAFELNWRQSDWYLYRKSRRWNMDQKEQCCLDTERCLDFPNYSSLKDHDCNPDKQSKDANYRVKIVDMFLIAAFIITLFKKGCHDFQNWNEHTDDEYDEIDAVPSTAFSSTSLFERTFPLQTSRSWQTFALFLLITPFVSLITMLSMHVLQFDDYYSLNSIQTSFVCVAIGLDFWTIRSLAINILQFWPFHIQPQIKIDLSKEEFVLWLGKESIPIMDISSIASFTEMFYVYLFASVIVSGLPLGMLSILVKSWGMKYDQYIVVLNVFGCSLILRSILGPQWFLEIVIAITWIFTPSMHARDEMGRALEKPSVRHVITNATVTSIILYIILFVTFKPIVTASIMMKILMFIIVVIVGSIVGSIIGMMRGLPVITKIHLTTWPSEGFSFVNDRCKMKPRTWAKLFGGGMNSVHINILQVQQQHNFRDLIRGSNSLEMTKASSEYSRFHSAAI